MDNAGCGALRYVTRTDSTGDEGKRHLGAEQVYSMESVKDLQLPAFDHDHHVHNLGVAGNVFVVPKGDENVMSARIVPSILSKAMTVVLPKLVKRKIIFTWLECSVTIWS